LLIPSFTLTRSEVDMYARVWKAVILPGKIEEFTAGLNSVRPFLRQQPGFCGLLVLRTGPGEGLEATIVSMWSSIDTLRESETPAFQQAVLNLLAYCEPRPSMREEEVVLSEFSSADMDATVTKF
jgi:heme-degrading monooxygenase HmoA